jgi:cyclophilin family peptidyl-prolyl cis-trans isomerase
MINQPEPDLKDSKPRSYTAIIIIAITLMILLCVGAGLIIWYVSQTLPDAISAIFPASTVEATSTLPVLKIATQSSLIKSTPGSQSTPALIGTKMYTSAPPMVIDLTKHYTATVKMAKGGQFIIQLFPDKAPLTVNNFVFLSKQGFYNGVTFHRVLENFMAQGGDPTGTGAGGPGYKFDNEDSDLKFDKAGVVAMANAGRDTNGSQFFITFIPTPTLSGGYTIFGQVISGMEVVNSLRRRDPNQNPTYQGDVIESITITEK